ncbi:hypothetical protein MKX08_009941 [Trichoderma sp. CBMAI-0020]|nr:hypothetical protein MKX08_009941 [Trichoderma sp. CBMAI-0020]
MAGIYTNLELDETTIAAASHQCLESFETCLAQASAIHPREFSRVEDQAGKFSTWASGIGVFAPGRASADHRLRYAPEVQSVAVGLLYPLNYRIRQCSGIIDGHGKNPESDVSSLTKALKRSCSDVASEISHLNKLSNMIRRISKKKNKTTEPVVVAPSEIQSATTLQPDRFTIAAISPSVGSAMTVALSDHETLSFPTAPGANAKQKFEQLKKERLAAHQTALDKLDKAYPNRDSKTFSRFDRHYSRAIAEKDLKGTLEADLQALGEITCPYCLEALPAIEAFDY